jgi:dUTP pyrophosphatase
MTNIHIKIRNTSSYALPTYATVGSAGMDIRANINLPIILKPFERCIIPTGLYVELPVGLEAQLRPRSGLAIKKGLTLVNCIGTIDSDYRGEIGVLMINLSTLPQTINPSERICQMVVAPYIQVTLEPAELLSKTDRGEGGMGSTGKS